MRASMLLFVFLAGCPATPAEPTTSNAPTTSAQTASRKVKFEDGAGRDVFALKQKDDGAKLVGANDEELARLKNKGDDVEVRAPDDTVLGRIAGDATKLKILSPTGEERFALKRYDDGDYKLKDASGATLYELKAKDYGFKIEDSTQAVVAKVKKRSDKVKLKNAEGATSYETKSPISALAIACLAFERLELPLRMGLVYRIERGP